MASLDADPADREAYDRFRDQLVAGEFEPVPDQKDCWEGPIFDCFSKLAPTQERMRIQIADGFPYTWPKVFVEGIVSDHVAASDEVCLWEPGTTGIGWMTLPEVEDRSIEWVRLHEHGFRPEDEVLDAHLYFEHRRPELAVVDLASLDISGQDKTDTLFAEWDEGERMLKLEKTGGSRGGRIEGRFYYHDRGVQVPPRDRAAFREALTTGQRANFNRRVENVRKGETRVVALFWDAKYGGRNALVLLLSPAGDGEVKAEALEVAPTDVEYRLLRAGPDADDLQSKKAVILGVGALGSHVAICLGQCGFGSATLIDNGVLRPADLTRYRGLPLPGSPKIASTATVLNVQAPSIKVDEEFSAPWSPARLRELISGSDVAVELTGSDRFAELLATEAHAMEIPLVSAALYRQGAVSRIRRQANGDVPLTERTDPRRYPIIPPPPDNEPRRLEPGCTEPVNNASPARVLQLAGDTSQVVIDTVCGRLDGPDEIIEVYTPLEVPPFDKRGVLGGGE